MPISFNCPSCGTFTEVADHFAGQSGPCKSCGNTITIPQAMLMPQKPLPATSSGSSAGIIIAIVLVGFVVFAGIGVALLLPAVQAAREAARRMQCSNNLKQIALAMHNYHDTYKAFPPAYTVDTDGNRLHSWRTLLLPYLEQNPLYDQIDLDKPWDAPENRHLADIVIPTYACPSHPNEGTSYTHYMVIVGSSKNGEDERVPGPLFQGEQPPRMRDVIDGTSNTILVVEVKDSQTSWMEPTDLSMDQMQMIINGGSTDPGSHHHGGMQVALADGSVRFIAETIDRDTWRNLITRDDGVPVSLD